jgi:TPR repeat protein
METILFLLAIGVAYYLYKLFYLKRTYGDAFDNGHEEQFQVAQRAYSKKDYEVAASIFLGLANQGHAESQVCVAQMHYYGVFFAKNKKTAYLWLLIALERGAHQDALKIKSHLENELSHDDIQRIEIKAKKWLEDYNLELSSKRSG